MLTTVSQPQWEEIKEKWNIKEGPRLKNFATRQFEEVIQALLDPAIVVTFKANCFDEMEAHFNQKIVNLTQILKHHPDFEHFEFSKEQLEYYVKFRRRKDGANFCQLNDRANGINHNLYTAEILALNQYTRESAFRPLQNFLRQQAKPSLVGLKNIDDILLTIGIASHALTKPLLYATTKTHSKRGENGCTSTPYIQEKLDDYKNHKLVRHEAFTSSSLRSDLSRYYRNAITFIEAPGLNPMGKAISAFSQFPYECEVLFAPGTEYVYVSSSVSFFGYCSFECVPIRSINHNNQSYSKEKAQQHEFAIIEKSLRNFYENHRHSLVRKLFDTVPNVEKQKCIKAVIDKLEELFPTVSAKKELSIENLIELKKSIIKAILYNEKLVNNAKYRASKGQTGAILNELLHRVEVLRRSKTIKGLQPATVMSASVESEVPPVITKPL